MDSSRVNNEYIKIVKEKVIYEDYLNTIKKVSESDAKYKGKPIPFLYHPLFITESDLFNFNKLVKIMMSISNKVVDQYLKSPQFRNKFGFSKLLERLILADHGYKTNIPMGRFDIFYKDGNFKFCELNTDGSSAMNEDNTLAQILLNTKSIQKMKEKYQIDYLDSINSWVDESLEIYQEYSKSPRKPVVGIVDFKESGTTAEFVKFKKAYINKGCDTFIIDARDLKYNKGNLYYQNNKLDLIYRRLVTSELIERSDEIKDLINAILDNAVCLIGPIKSQIMHNKIIFKILHDEDTQILFNREEVQFIKDHIPYTRLFSESYNNFQEVYVNKDKYIIKPYDLYGSRGVYAGLSFTQSQWKEILNKCFNNNYLFQEYFYPYQREFIEFAEKKVQVNLFSYITGLFVYNEKLSGLYTRIGKNHIISGLHGYYTVPNLVVKEKVIGEV